MANGTTTTTTKPPQVGTTPQTGGLNYPDYQKKLQRAAASTRNVSTPSLEPAQQAVSKLSDQFKPVGQAMVENVRAESQAQKQRGERAASALEMVGSSTLSGLSNLERLQESIRGQAKSASESFDAAAEKADEYVQAARGRVTEVLGKLDDIFQDMNKTRNFSKAHSMQASVQAAIGSMKNEERNILQNYGADSKEYAQFQQSKRQALGTVQSNIHASYAQLEEQQKTNFLNATTDAYTKSNMYVGFQEQQHVEMLKYRDTQRQAYALKSAELDATLEQMKMGGMENLANWMIQTPSFTMDMTPMMTLIADLTEQDQMTNPSQGSKLSVGPGAVPIGGGNWRVR